MASSHLRMGLHSAEAKVEIEGIAGRAESAAGELALARPCQPRQDIGTGTLQQTFTTKWGLEGNIDARGRSFRSCLKSRSFREGCSGAQARHCAGYVAVGVGREFRQANAEHRVRNWFRFLGYSHSGGEDHVTTGIDIGGLYVANTGYAGVFHSGINATATWDVGLIEARGKAIGPEFHGKGVNVALGPMMNMGPQAAAGRNWEGFGADPFLCCVANAATFNGIQSNGVIAPLNTLSAFPIYSSNIDDKTFRELYLWPFAEAVHTGVCAVMCAYNTVNQTQAGQNSKIINGMSKEDLGFMANVGTEGTSENFLFWDVFKESFGGLIQFSFPAALFLTAFLPADAVRDAIRETPPRASLTLILGMFSVTGILGNNH
ncbi:glycosyl hydrolase family 3 N terminal domain-containing protein [Mycena leptocephala]|nr:glycosyl hydrolase family 3 N terminal domain-containing protein [Mycena leptocephala]